MPRLYLEVTLRVAVPDPATLAAAGLDSVAAFAERLMAGDPQIVAVRIIEPAEAETHDETKRSCAPCSSMTAS